MTKILSIRQSFLPEVTPWTFLGGSHTCFLSFSLLNKGDSFLLPPWFSHYWGPPPQTWPDISQHFISLHFSTFLYISLHFSAVEKCREMSRNARVKSGGTSTVPFYICSLQVSPIFFTWAIPYPWIDLPFLGTFMIHLSWYWIDALYIQEAPVNIRSNYAIRHF